LISKGWRILFVLTGGLHGVLTRCRSQYWD
jgi:hypothetical protein